MLQKHADKCRVTKRVVYYNWSKLLLKHWFNGASKVSYMKAKGGNRVGAAMRVGGEGEDGVGSENKGGGSDGSSSDNSRGYSMNYTRRIPAGNAKSRAIEKLTLWTG